LEGSGELGVSFSAVDSLVRRVEGLCLGHPNRRLFMLLLRLAHRRSELRLRINPPCECSPIELPNADSFATIIATSRVVRVAVSWVWYTRIAVNLMFATWVRARVLERSARQVAPNAADDAVRLTLRAMKPKLSSRLSALRFVLAPHEDDSRKRLSVPFAYVSNRCTCAAHTQRGREREQLHRQFALRTECQHGRAV
jgi:hypothetical protein